MPPSLSKLPIKGDLWKLNSFRKVSLWAVRGVQRTPLPAPVNSHASLAPSNPYATMAAPGPCRDRRSGLQHHLFPTTHMSCKQAPSPLHRVAPRRRRPSSLPGFQHLELEPRPLDFKQHMRPLRTKQRMPPSKQTRIPFRHTLFLLIVSFQ